MKKFKFIIYSSVLFLILIVFCVSCNRNKDSYSITTTIPSTESNDKINITIKLYLETSVSMKGYVNPNVTGVYKLVDVLPRLITDLGNKEHGYDSLELYTITDEPRRFRGTNKEFSDHLRTGSIMAGKSSRLHNMFRQIIDSTNDTNNISIFISDCILDLGRSSNSIAEKSILTTEIYSFLSRRNNIRSIVYQFNSDFKGEHYYNVRNQTPSPYQGRILHKRPFYVWVLGNSENLKEFLEKKIINNYDNIYTFGLSNIPLQYKICNLKIAKHINAYFPKNNVDTFRINKIPAVLTFGISLNNFPSYVTTDYTKENIKIDKEYLKITVDVKHRDSLDSYKKNNINRETELNSIKSLFYKYGLDHIVILSFSTIPKESFKLYILKKEQKWIKQCSLDDDVGLTDSLLEGKTFSFQNLIRAFSDTFKNDTLFSIKINYNKKQ